MHFRRLLEWQQKGRCHWLVIESDVPHEPLPEIVGSGQLIAYGQRIEIANLIVVPEQRSQGIGTAMIQIFMNIAHHLEHPGVEISVSEANGQALVLYQRLGFVEIRRLSINATEQAIILQKAL